MKILSSHAEREIFNMTYTWVIGVFTGKAAESVKAHADSGIGYFIRDERGRGSRYEVEAAFRRANDSPIPSELTTCDWRQVDILEMKYARRHDAHRKIDRGTTVALDVVANKLLEKRNGEKR